MSAPRFRRALVALAAFTLACGDSTGPSSLSEEQVGDMLDAMNAVSYVSNLPIPGASLHVAALRQAPQTASVVVSVSETVDCPNGGSATVTGTSDSDEEAGTLDVQVTQSYSNCAATSESGRVWTFNANPGIVTTVSANYNETAGTFSMTATQAGSIQFASDLASGSCQVNLTMTMNGTENEGFSISVNGSACGRNFHQVVEVSP